MDKRAQDSARRATISDWLRSTGDQAGLSPPLQVRGAEKLYVTTTIDPERVQPFLPAALRVSPTNTGVMSAFTVADSPVGTWSCAVLGVAVAGHDSTEGIEGVYWTGAYADADGLRLMQSYDADILLGSVHLHRENDLFSAEMWAADGSGHVTFAVRASGEPEAIFDGAYNYLGSDGSGGAFKFSIIGHDRRVIQGELASVDIGNDASPGIASLRPLTLNWGVYHSHIDYIMGVPRRLDVSSGVIDNDAHVGLLLATFDNQGRAALMLDAKGTIRFRNEAADRALGSRLRNGTRLVSELHGDQHALTRSLDAVRDGRSVSEWIALSEGRQLGTVVAQMTALDERIVGPGGVMVVLAEPGAKTRDDADKVLRLLGLTAAEANLAAAIGRGASPREAAARLGITEGTARSTLRQIFEKLQINRQSELARIVARVEVI